MGLFASRPSNRNEESDVVTNQAYKYPPKCGDYFSNYFIMGGEKFDSPDPEAYLFGDNMDLNFLGNKPIPFPYAPPEAGDPTLPLKCLINIRRESVRFVRINVNNEQQNEQDQPLQKSNTSYNVEFVFDADVRCSITIYYLCSEEITCNGIRYIPKDDKFMSEVYYYKRGSNQQFSQNKHIFDPSSLSEDELFYDFDKDLIPVAIQCVALEGPDEIRQSHTTIAIIERHSDESYSLKALKQKLFADGLCYLLQEIYGIENKINESVKETNEDEVEDGGLECVICMSDMRDTLILPCRHLCLCQACADSLRYQASNCPICRSPFRALLQIKALSKSADCSVSLSEIKDGVPAGFERVSLIEALNGPIFAKRYPGVSSSALEPLLDPSNITTVIHSSIMRNK